ncbi:Retrovirus-related Pol polyprotein from transposon 17.6 [Exaiptasia diaphana]|nr:Retrovirus-related Pol polyprotein from transposon 17.6 [Exaiptasia diaphana]
MANQVGKYIPNLADLTKPLRELLVKENARVWNEAQATAFEVIKEKLSSTPTLETKVSADISSYGLGSLLKQKHADDVWKPVVYISRALNTDTETRYAQFEKEALATTWACERFEDFLVGKRFHVETDHKPFVPLFVSKNLSELPSRIQRLRMRLMRFDFSISHVAGKDLITADTLSRAPLSKCSDPDDLLLPCWADRGSLTVPRDDSNEFAKFASEWDFRHVTSSPIYPQSNGGAERAVQTVKNLLKKSTEPAKVVLTYRAAPLKNGKSPAELHTIPGSLTPSWPGISEFRAKEEERKLKQKVYFDLHHNAKDLSTLVPGQRV